MARFTFASRYIPQGSIKITEKSGLATVYVYTTAKGRPAAIAYIGKSNKAAWHFSFMSEKSREEKIASQFDSLRKHEAAKLARRAESNQPHSIKVGTIITNSWGYDQTNVDWYAVVEVTRNYVYLRPIAAARTSDASGPMSGYCTAAVDVSDPNPEKWGVTFTSDKVTRHKVVGNSVTMKYGCGSIWHGEAKYESWYA